MLEGRALYSQPAETALLPFLSEAILWMPDHLDEASAWIEHIPFAFWIMEALAPSCFVELGTHTGVSHLAFCQAAQRLGIETRGYAVDTWLGDEHTGFYGEEVFQKLSQIHDLRYGHFSRLVRTTFDEAVQYFDDSSVELLHIDGLHTYQAVKHDFVTWRPKLAPRALVLLHDTNVRERDFGVFRLWRELAESHAHFEFLHGHGLGVLGVGSGFPPAVAALFGASHQPRTANRIRELFARFGAQLSVLPRQTVERERFTLEVRTRDARIDELQNALAARQNDAQRLSGELDQRNARLEELGRELSSRSLDAQRLSEALAAGDVRIEELENSVRERKARIENLESALATARGEWERATGNLADRDGQIADLQSALTAQQAGEQQLSAELAKRAAKLRKLKRSFSWRTTAPLRWSGRASRGVAQVVRKSTAATSRFVCLPLRAPLRWLALRHRALMRLSRLLPESQRRMIGDVWLLRASSVFDQRWYVEQNPNVAKAGKDPIVHYVRRGAKKGRNPSPQFDGNWYLAENPDVGAARMNPLVHYVRFGAAEGRRAERAYGGGLSIKREGNKQPADARKTYAKWIQQFDSLTAEDVENILMHIGRLTYRPVLSVIMPVYNVEVRWLREAIDSVRNQLYPYWELCIADDHSTNQDILNVLREYEELDSRIRVYFRQENGGIARASNTALKLASGEFVVLMDHDDVIPRHALYMAAVELNVHRDADLIYSDEDKISIEGQRREPYFKCDWNPSLILSQNFFSHLGVYRRSLVEEVGGFRIGFDGSQDYDLVLRCAERTSPDRIRHIPHVLYHWRSIPQSTASSIDSKPFAWEAGSRAISEHLKRRCIDAEVRRALADFYAVDYRLPKPPPKVSIIVPTTAQLRLLKPCLTTLFQKTVYPDYEVLIAVNEKHYALPDRREFLEAMAASTPLRLLVYRDRPFNFAWVNNWASSHAAGSVFCLMNDDVRVATPDWLEALVARVCLEGVGVVGPLMLYPDDTIQHGGVILGPGGVADHAHRCLPRGEFGYFGRAGLDQDLSCVTAGCMVIRRKVFEVIGGFDERFEIAFNDVDLCIRVRHAGWRIIWTPASTVYHHESASLGRHDSPERASKFADEVQMMRAAWGTYLDNDPYYSPNLSLAMGKIFTLAFPPRREVPWRADPQSADTAAASPLGDPVTATIAY